MKLLEEVWFVFEYEHPWCGTKYRVGPEERRIVFCDIESKELAEHLAFSHNMTL